ncbi:hypothetical protein [Salinibius halmophilus]|uniref:hypothetical protein n=1 Tax=Salinibius halmophilus TaxID=1853216 RepID=UPI000E65EF2A|nr:hypothetical protein [Salinibius halmophilus]
MEGVLNLLLAITGIGGFIFVLLATGFYVGSSVGDALSDQPQAKAPTDEFSVHSIDNIKIKSSDLGHRFIVIGASLLFVAMLLAMWIKHVVN